MADSPSVNSNGLSDEESRGGEGEPVIGAVSMLLTSPGSEIVVQNQQAQIVPRSIENENQVGEPQQSEVVIAGGSFKKAVFGPQTDNRKVELKAEYYTGSTISHHHEVHHHYAPGGEVASTSGLATPGRSADAPQPDEGYSQISDDIFICETPLRKGTRIYKGYQQHASGDRRQLAIKIITPCEDVHLNEVRNLLRLMSHPNVVQIIKSKVKQGTPRMLYIAMEYCSSQNLQDFFDENKKKKISFNVNKAMLFAKQLVDGLKHIHKNKIIHRDLKPENLLLALDMGTIKICDFGISKRMQSGRSFTKLTAPGQGTDGYKAPESFESDVLSQSADIFCLGLILYAIFSNGKHAFGQNIHLQNYNIISSQGRDLTGLLISGPKMHELLDLLNQTLQHDLKKRPTIEQVANHSFFTNSDAPSSSTGCSSSANTSIVLDEECTEAQSVAEHQPSTLVMVEFRSGILTAVDVKNRKHNVMIRVIKDFFLRITSLRGELYLFPDQKLCKYSNTGPLRELGYFQKKPHWSRQVVTFREHVYVIDTNSVQGYNPSKYIWTEELPGCALSAGFCVAASQDFIFAFGGFETGQEARRLDLEAGSWSKLAPMQEWRVNAAAVVFREKLYVMGGRNGSQVLNSVESYNRSSDTWEVLGNMNRLRERFGAVVCNDKLYAVGGDRDEKGERHDRDSIEVFNQALNKWEITQTLPKATGSISACVCKSSVLQH